MHQDAGLSQTVDHFSAVRSRVLAEDPAVITTRLHSDIAWTAAWCSARPVGIMP
jgi:hypothetical protein